MYFQLCCIVFLFMLWQIKFSLSLSTVGLVEIFRKGRGVAQTLEQGRTDRDSVLKIAQCNNNNIVTCIARIRPSHKCAATCQRQTGIFIMYV